MCAVSMAPGLSFTACVCVCVLCGCVGGVHGSLALVHRWCVVCACMWHVCTCAVSMALGLSFTACVYVLCGRVGVCAVSMAPWLSLTVGVLCVVCACVLMGCWGFLVPVVLWLSFSMCVRCVCVSLPLLVFCVFFPCCILVWVCCFFLKGFCFVRSFFPKKVEKPGGGGKTPNVLSKK